MDVRAECRTDIGRADKGRSFVRVTHLPTGIERIQVGLGSDSSAAVRDKLIQEIAVELAAREEARQ